MLASGPYINRTHLYEEKGSSLPVLNVAVLLCWEVYAGQKRGITKARE